MDVALVDLFWSLVDRRGPSECWPWLGKHSPEGYGRFAWKGRWVYAHRCALELDVGRPIAPRKMALHRPLICNNKGCVNGAHLYEGGKSQNARDSVTDGTHGQSSKRLCTNGHPYDSIAWNGARVCRRCKIAYWREYNRTRRKPARSST